MPLFYIIKLLSNVAFVCTTSCTTKLLSGNFLPSLTLSFLSLHLYRFINVQAIRISFFPCSKEIESKQRFTLFKVLFLLMIFTLWSLPKYNKARQINSNNRKLSGSGSSSKCFCNTYFFTMLT